MPLQIAIVGAGIAGLSAAIGLQCAGHDVVIYERSRFKNEVGAAIVISPNATSVLDRWAFDFDTAGAVDNCQMRRVRADNLEVDSQEIFTETAAKYGNRWAFFHRADLHTGLRSLVQAPIELASEVTKVDPHTATITLIDGRVIRKDLLVIADGAHCQNIPTITGQEAPVVKTPMSMYRFLIPIEKIMEDEKTRSFYANEPPGLVTFYGAEVGRPGLLLNTYPCRRGQLMYCALLHPTRPDEQNIQDWNHEASAEDVMNCAKTFHPSIRAICEKATDVKVHNQMFRNAIPRFTNGKAVLIGDAAHFMLPTHGQGASSSIEDAAALQVLLAGADADEVEARLDLFQSLRHPRATATQAMSNYMMVGGPKMTEEARKYYDGPLPPPSAKTFSQPFSDFFFRYDIFQEAKKVLRPECRDGTEEA